MDEDVGVVGVVIRSMSGWVSSPVRTATYPQSHGRTIGAKTKRGVHNERSQ